MKLLSIVAALSILSMTEGANLRSVQHNQVEPSKGMESPVVGSLRHKQILDDNNDAAWERELKKKKGKKDAKVRRSSKWG